MSSILRKLQNNEANDSKFLDNYEEMFNYILIVESKS